jgi:hypothetical protein
MTILKAGSGPVAFSASSFSTSAGNFREGFATCAAVGPCSAELKAAIPDGDPFWVHFVAYTYFNDVSVLNSGQNVVAGYDASGQISFKATGVGPSSGADNMYASAYNTGGGSANSSVGEDLGLTSRLITFDAHISTEGENSVTRLYLNGGIYATAIVPGVSRGLKSLGFNRITAFPSAWRFSELIVSTTDTRGLSVRTMLLTGDGTHAEMIGDYSDVDDPGGPDGLVLKAISAEQKSSFIKAAVSGEFSTGTVIVSALASAATGYDMVAGLRIGGVDYYGDPMGLTTGLVPAESHFLVSPATGLPFTAAEINAAEVIVKAIALP